jgi:hypothetical protein
MAHVAPVLLYTGIYVGGTFADAGATPNAIIGFGVLVLLAAALQRSGKENSFSFLGLQQFAKRPKL